ncbi:tetratricopeptide repeat protein [Candidatus Poribacteria bacterium]|nr:tetratricopeptide repeat protein [Candidatus Poribacteria bacterium]
MQSQPSLLSEAQTHQLNGLLNTVDQLTADSISGWHQSLAEEIHSATSRIQGLMVSTSQQDLVGELAKALDTKQQAILSTLAPPLKAVEKLVLSGHLNDAQKIKLLIELGRTYELLTQWEAALDRFDQAFDYIADDPAEKAKVLKSIGGIKSKQRDFREANKQYQASLAIYEELQDFYQVAQLHINIGWDEFQSGNYSETIENYNLALSLAQTTEGAERLVADVSMNLGILATVKGDSNSALSHYEQSVDVYTEIDDERGLSQAYYNMAMLCVDTK